jgi:hypothetical protein
MEDRFDGIVLKYTKLKIEAIINRINTEGVVLPQNSIYSFKNSIHSGSILL